MANIHSMITFCLVNIPVSVGTLIKNNDISFFQVHKKCLERIKYQKYCPHCKKVLKESEIEKGYINDEDEMIVFDQKELTNLKPENEGEIEIVSFFNSNEIDPKYYQKTYVIVPEKKGKAYFLLRDAMQKMKCVALCKTVLYNKFTYAILRISEDIFLLTTIYFAEEVNDISTYKSPKISAKELELATSLIKKMTAHFEPQKYKDEYHEKVLKAIELKSKGKKVPKSKKKSSKEIASMMNALEKSLIE